MIIDVSGIVLFPGNGGKDCPGNEKNKGKECCCDECDYMVCCVGIWYLSKCKACGDRNCPRKELLGMEEGL